MTRRLVGLAATLGIIGLLVGIPVALYVAAGSPIPSSPPDTGELWDRMTRPDDGTFFLAALKVIGWLAWASFAAMVLLEVVARLRGVPAPRIPALGVQQRAAAGLVAAAALLFTVAPMVSPAPASAEPSSPASGQVGVSAPAVAGFAPSVAPVAQAPVAAAPSGPQVATEAYVVEQGDSLWAIAEARLGDGARFKEIAELNYGVPQADGSALDSSHWIQPGWELRVPVQASTFVAEHVVVVEPGDTLSQIALDELGDAQRYPELFAASKDTVQPDGDRLTDPDLIRPGWRITVPAQGVEPSSGKNERSTIPGSPSPQSGSQDGTGLPMTQLAEPPARSAGAPPTPAPTPSPADESAGDVAPDAVPVAFSSRLDSDRTDTP